MRDRNVIVQEISKAFNSNVPNEFKSSLLKYLYMNSVGDISLIESFEYDELPTIEYGGQFISFKPKYRNSILVDEITNFWVIFAFETKYSDVILSKAKNL